MSYKAFGMVEEGNEVFVGGIRFLEETWKVQGQHMIPDTAVLAVGDAAVETGNGNVVAGDILAHETDRRAGREIVTNPGQEAERFAGETGENQMADERAAKHDAVRGIPWDSGLAAHLGDSRRGLFKIVRCTGAELSGAGGPMLEIRQVDIDDTVEKTEGFDGFVAGGVPDEGERRTPEIQRLKNPRDEGRRGDERNRMDAEIREAPERVGELTGRKRTSLIAVGDIAVLAVYAAEGATGEKDRTGAAGAGDRRLFPKMGGDTGNEHLFRQTAEARMHGAVSAAVPRTEITFHRQMICLYPPIPRRCSIAPARERSVLLLPYQMPSRLPSDRYASDRHIMNRRRSRVNRQVRPGEMDKGGGLDYNIYCLRLCMEKEDEALNREDLDGLSRDADISAQHRHRRQGSAADEAAMAPYRRPVQTGIKNDTSSVRQAGHLPPEGKAGEPEAEEEKIDFRKPIMPVEKEIPQRTLPARDDTGAGEDTETKGAAAGISDEDTRRLDLHGSIVETAKEEGDGRNDSPLGSRADSRVPEEARRMAAAPYGTGKPAPRRPGTRPMTAARRVDGGDGSSVSGANARAERANGRALARELRRQAAVGYAPGRMNEGQTRKIPTQAELREEAANEEYEYSGNREARAYLERRGQPFRETDAPEPAAKTASRGLKLLVIALLLVGAVLTGLLVMRNRKGTDKINETVEVISFEETKPEGATVCTDVSYSILTGKGVKNIRLVDQNGKAVPISGAGVGNADGNVWMITLNMKEDFEGTLRLEIRGEDGKWQKTNQKTSKLAVKGALAPTTGLQEMTTPAPGAEEEGLFASLRATEEPDSEEENPEEAEEETAALSVMTEEPSATEAPAATEEPVTTEAPDSEETPEPEAEEASEGADEEKPGDEAEGIVEDSGEENGDENGETRAAGELRTAVPTNTPEPQEIEKPTETPPLTVEAAPEANPDLITNTTVYSGSKKQKNYARPLKELIHMPEADLYTQKKMGVLTFRGDNFRRNAAVGTLEAEATGLKKKWEVEGGSARGVNQTFYGYGWPGQPAIVQWSKQVRAVSNLYESKQTKEKLKEVIIAGQDGAIRFLDLDDGSITRNSIKLGYPMNGTPSLHTVGQPYMSVGQFARKMKVKTGRIGLRTYNLYNTKELKLIDGSDSKHRRALNNNGSFQTSALYDRTSDTMITAGSNGMVYLEALNSEFDWKAGSMKVSLSETTMTSKAKGQKSTAQMAVESSLAAYDKYIFYADMGGVLRCVDTDTLQPVWAVATGDAVMAAVALDLTEDRELNLYTANMLANRKKGNDQIQIRRYDALSGKEAWCTDVGVTKGKKDKADVGAKASPVIGQQKLKDLVYFTVTGLSEEGRVKLNLSGDEKSALIALNKDSGKVVWAMGMESRTESSPVAVYDKDGNGWIIQCAQDGNIYLLEGLTGRKTGSLNMEAEIIASPAVYNDTMVIGTTGKGTSFIYGIEIQTMKPQDEPEAEEEQGEAEPEKAEPEMKEEADPADEEAAPEDGEEEWADAEGEENYE